MSFPPHLLPHTHVKECVERGKVVVSSMPKLEPVVELQGGRSTARLRGKKYLIPTRKHSCPRVAWNTKEGCKVLKVGKFKQKHGILQKQFLPQEGT